MYDGFKKGDGDMRKAPIIITFCVLMAGITACGSRTQTTQNQSNTSGIQSEDKGQKADTEEVTDSEEKKILVAYFTYAENIGDTSDMSVDAITSASLRTTDNTEGNLQLMADMIQEKTNADVFHIVVQDPYEREYEDMHDRAIEEIDEESFPALTEQVENMDQYDEIYLGTPVWSGTLPRPVATFLTENDVSQKTIIPFGINLGSGFGRIPDVIEKLCPNTKLEKGFTIEASTANDEVRSEFGQWLEEQGN